MIMPRHTAYDKNKWLKLNMQTTLLDIMYIDV